MSKRTPATKALSMLLALILVLSLFPAMTASAAESYTGKVVSALTDGNYIIVDRYSPSYNYYALSNSATGNSGSGYGFKGESVIVSGRLSAAAGRRNPYSTSTDLRLWSPPNIA